MINRGSINNTSIKDAPNMISPAVVKNARYANIKARQNMKAAIPTYVLNIDFETLGLLIILTIRKRF